MPTAASIIKRVQRNRIANEPNSTRSRPQKEKRARRNHWRQRQEPVKTDEVTDASASELQK